MHANGEGPARRDTADSNCLRFEVNNKLLTKLSHCPLFAEPAGDNRKPVSSCACAAEQTTQKSITHHWQFDHEALPLSMSAYHRPIRSHSLSKGTSPVPIAIGFHTVELEGRCERQC